MKANMPENAQDRAAFTYNAAADFFDASPLSFWDYFGRRTIELASLPSGSRVLDVCCGAAASALPAAEVVGPAGKVIGVDLAKQLLESASSIKNVRPDLYKGFNPWDRIDDPGTLRKILHEGGVPSAKIIAESRLHPIKAAEDWWTIVLGSGYRGTIEQLTLAERQKVKKANLAFIRDEKISSIETNVLYALATKPQTANFE